MKIKIFALVLALVLCAGSLAGCSKDGGDGAETSVSVSEYTGTGGTLELPEVTGGDADIEAFYEEQYKNMTPEEIAQFEQDLKDLGITKEELFNLMYYSDGSVAATAGAETTGEETTAK